jgi:hypothetical protein
LNIFLLPTEIEILGKRGVSPVSHGIKTFIRVIMLLYYYVITLLCYYVIILLRYYVIMLLCLLRILLYHRILYGVNKFKLYGIIWCGDRF